ncbi:Ldh family oxidoreductase [Cupriavidus necator]|uniref:Ldh family oxidoreductase n=1 Tax=Cupriavidus necator TaxID=106590 RepID=UPI003F50BA59
MRHVREAAQRSEPIPADWAVSRHGEPTTNALEALAGALLPAGGTRGFGIGLMSEVLASFFTDSGMSLDTESLQTVSGPAHGLGVFCLLLDPTAIARDHFGHKLDRLKDAIVSQPGTRLPGTKQRAQERVTVDRAMWEKAQSLAESRFDNPAC